MTVSIPKDMKVWGLTGGIGSGKSLAAQFFQELGIAVINLDHLGKEVLESDSSAHQEIKNQFGEQVFVQGLPDKKFLKKLIFEDDSKRQELEKILHPKIWKLFEKKLVQLSQMGTKLVLCEAALLIEHKHHSLFPRLIVILADTDLRKQRVLNRDQIPPQLFEEILKSQVTDFDRKAVATDLILNNQSPESLKKAVLALIEKWKKEKLLN